MPTRWDDLGTSGGVPLRPNRRARSRAGGDLLQHGVDVTRTAVLCGFAGAVLSGSFSLTQVVRIARARTTAGLSEISWLLLALTFGTWLSWGILTHDPYQIVPNATSFVGAVWVLWRIHCDRPIRWRAAAATAAAVVLAFALQRLGGLLGALAAVFTVTGVIRARQVAAVRGASDISAVTLMPWLISSTAQVFWFIYGLSAARWVVALHAPYAIATNLLLILQVLRRRRHLAAL